MCTRDYARRSAFISAQAIGSVAAGMTIIGTFSYDRSSDSFTGEVCTLLVDRHTVYLRPVRMWFHKTRTYRVFVDTPIGLFRCGTATANGAQAALRLSLTDPITGCCFRGALVLAADDTATFIWDL
jgi:uncharacterized protein (DUF736 family)